MADEMLETSIAIEVDDAAAYFGATESSDVLHAMMAMPREQAMIEFFERLSDIVLRPGDFDFEAASERMQCEGGEIYYLVAGHLGLMGMPDPILRALGQDDSTGEAGTPVDGLSEPQRESLQRLADPMRMMKLFAVAFQTGAKDEVVKYMAGLEGYLGDVAASLEPLVTIEKELSESLDVAGHVLPIGTLATSSASAATVDVPTSTAPPVQSTPVEEAKAPETMAPSPAPSKPVAPISSEPSVPLPATSVALPDIIPEKVSEPAVNIENEKQVAKATQDAFSGAFSSELVPDPPSVPSASTDVPLEPETPVEDEETFVSAAEHFIAADEDNSGALDVEELAQATGTTIEEATALHAEADTDGDGVVSLSEFIASPAAEKTAALPKPVAPVRRPLAQRQPQPSPQPAAPQQPPPPQPQPWQQQQRWPQQQPPQQRWPQQPTPQQAWPQQPVVQPTIRSGVHCRNCGIGLDPYWRFCPVCGGQNLGY